jgi:hypothetical protein
LKQFLFYFYSFILYFIEQNISFLGLGNPSAFDVLQNREVTRRRDGVEDTSELYYYHGINFFTFASLPSPTSNSLEKQFEGLNLTPTNCPDFHNFWEVKLYSSMYFLFIYR